MKLEDQVCSLDLAKRLKELGVKQESFADWCELDDDLTLCLVRKPAEFEKIDDDAKAMCFSAFTVAELGEMLPHKIGQGDETLWLYCWKGERGFSVAYGEVVREAKEYAFSFSIPHVQDADTEADARAKMLIYLVENKLITV